MARLPNSYSDSGLVELKLITKSVGLLAALTGLVYLRVVGAESLGAIRTNTGHWPILVLLGLLILSMLGLLAAWRQEGFGGALTAASAVGVGICAYLSFPDYRLFAAFAYGSPFLITGLLFLACWWRRAD